MKGVQFVVDEAGKQQAVLIDLRHHRKMWEDFYDAFVAQERANEPRESFDDVQRRILGEDK
jgi:hypothetical protein